MSAGQDPFEPLLESAFQLSIRPAESGDLNRYAKLATKLHLVADNAIAGLEATEGPVACKAGCHACCNRVVVGNIPEVVEVASVVANWPAEARDALFERIGAYEDDALQEWAQRLPCPFLFEGLCSIYANRPLSCRSLSSRDASICERVATDSSLEIPTRPSQEAIAGTIDEAILRALNSIGRPAGVFDLPCAVRHLLQHPEQQTILVDPGQTASLARYEVDSGPSMAMIPIGPSVEPVLQFAAFRQFQEAIAEQRHVAALASLKRIEYTPAGLIGQVTMPPISASQEEMEESWAKVGAALDRLEEAEYLPQEGFEALGIFNTFRLASAGKDVKPYLQRFMTYCHDKFARPTFPGLTAPIDQARRPGPLRVGFVSHRMSKFNGSKWALGWLGGLNRDFETYAFHIAGYDDLFSCLWRRQCDHYFRLPVPIHESAAFIRSLDLDALVFTDIGISAVSIQLSLLRLARFQVTGWGHSTTSGSPEIDCYLSSELMEPEGAEAHYTEELVRLPNSGLSLPPLVLERSAGKSAADFGLPESGFILCAQNLSKLLPSQDPLLREVSEKSGLPICFFLHPANGFNFEDFKTRMTTAGVNAVYLPSLGRPDYLRVVELAEFLLDSPAWHGGNTTLDALALGKAVLALPGEFMRGRHDVAFLTLAGVGGLIAKDEADLVALAGNRDRREEILKGLDANALFGDPVASAAFADFLRGRA